MGSYFKLRPQISQHTVRQNFRVRFYDKRNSMGTHEKCIGGAQIGALDPNFGTKSQAGTLDQALVIIRLSCKKLN